MFTYFAFHWRFPAIFHRPKFTSLPPPQKQKRKQRIKSTKHPNDHWKSTLDVLRKLQFSPPRTPLHNFSTVNYLPSEEILHKTCKRWPSLWNIDKCHIVFHAAPCNTLLMELLLIMKPHLAMLILVAIYNWLRNHNQLYIHFQFANNCHYSMKDTSLSD